MIRFKIEFTGPGMPGVATHYFGGNPDSADLTNARDRVVAAWQAWDDVMSNSTRWTLNPEAAVVDVATGDLTGVRSVVTATALGAQTGETLPTLVQGLIKWNTGIFIGGRRLIGHTFIPAPVEANNPAGVGPRPDGTYLTALAAGITAMLGAPSPGLVIWHRPKRDPVTNVVTVPGTSSPATAGAASLQWSVLRTRRS